MRRAAAVFLAAALVAGAAAAQDNYEANDTIGTAYDLPLLTVVFNNERWNAVTGSTKLMYPDGYAAKLNEGVPLSQLKPSPAFEKYVEASGGLGIRVEKPDELAGALERGLHAVQEEKRQAVLNVLIA